MSVPLGRQVLGSEAPTIEGVDAMSDEMRNGMDARDVGPDPEMNLGDLERVEVAPDYCAELAVPLSSAQLAAVDRLAHERGISPGRAAQLLVEQALAALDRP